MLCYTAGMGQSQPQPHQHISSDKLREALRLRLTPETLQRLEALNRHKWYTPNPDTTPPSLDDVGKQ